MPAEHRIGVRAHLARQVFVLAVAPVLFPRLPADSYGAMGLARVLD